MSAETVPMIGQVEDPNLAYEMAHAERPYRNEIKARGRRLIETIASVEGSGSTGQVHATHLRKSIKEGDARSLANAAVAAEVARERHAA